jgi:hypothetical protein
MSKWQRVPFLAASVLVIGGVLLAGCAEQKAAPAQRQIQADSDRFFDKMKQEEQEHGTGPGK